MADEAQPVGEAKLARIQAISGLLFASFLILHLINTALAAAGQDVYDGWQRAMRWYYQFPVVEIVCVAAAMLVHMWASATRIVRRRRRARERGEGGAKARPSLRVRLHRYAGYYLFAAAAAHMVATRLPGLFGHPADFTFLTFSLSYAGIFFYPYYALLALSGLIHLAHGVPTALRVIGARVPGFFIAARSPAFWGVAALGGGALVLGVIALGGNLFEVDTTRFAEWKRMYEFLPSSMLPWK